MVTTFADGVATIARMVTAIVVANVAAPATDDDAIVDGDACDVSHDVGANVVVVVTGYVDGAATDVVFAIVIVATTA